MNIKKSQSSCKINRIEICEDKLTSRGGLYFFGHYLTQTKVLDAISTPVSDLRKSKKGKSVEVLLKQLLCAFADGRGQSMLDFNELKKDPAHAAILEMPQEDMAGTDIMKRFFRKFYGSKWQLFRQSLQQIFLWRLHIEKPQVIMLDLDTMVLNNNDALQREGCKPTYKKVKGFQNLQLTWQGRIVDVLFRSGEKHSNHGDDVLQVLSKAIKAIRSHFDKNIPIIVTIDSGFLDDKIFRKLEKMNVGYVCSGKLYTSIRTQLETIPKKEFYHYCKGSNCWAYTQFESSLGTWDGTTRKTIYTTLVEEEGQLSLPFCRPDAVYYTNLGNTHSLDQELIHRGYDSYLSAQGIVEIAHGRGDSERCNRSIKEFMSKEHLPFKRFAMNAAYYLLQVISHFMLECFRLDVASNIIPQRAYPNTIRRTVIDFAAKVVCTGGKIILKIPQTIWDRLGVEKILFLYKQTPKLCT